MNPDAKLTQKAAAVRSILPGRASKCHTARALVLLLAWRREEELPLLALLPAVPQSAMLSSLPGWTVHSPLLCLEEFGSCMDLCFSSSYWIGLFSRGLSFLPMCASIHGFVGDWECQEGQTGYLGFVTIAIVSSTEGSQRPP